MLYIITTPRRLCRLTRPKQQQTKERPVNLGTRQVIYNLVVTW